MPAQLQGHSPSFLPELDQYALETIEPRNGKRMSILYVVISRDEFCIKDRHLPGFPEGRFPPWPCQGARRWIGSPAHSGLNWAFFTAWKGNEARVAMDGS